MDNHSFLCLHSIEMYYTVIYFKDTQASIISEGRLHLGAASKTQVHTYHYITWRRINGASSESNSPLKQATHHMLLCSIYWASGQIALIRSWAGQFLPWLHKRAWKLYAHLVGNFFWQKKCCIKDIYIYIYIYLITRVSMQYRKLLHEWAWYFHEL